MRTKEEDTQRATKNEKGGCRKENEEKQRAAMQT